MPGRKDKPISIPICSFETIAERTKSGNRRESKPPQRFEFEYQYFPKLTIKRENSFNDSLDYQYLNQNMGSIPFPKPKRKYQRTNGFNLKKERLSSSADYILNPLIGITREEYVTKDLNVNRYNVCESNVLTSTPKSLDMKRDPETPHLMTFNGGSHHMLPSIPPKLVPIDESETEIESFEEIPPPPTLMPVYDINDIDDCHQNRDYVVIEKCKKSSNGNPLNGKTLFEFELNKRNRELEDLRKKFALNLAEIQRQKEDNIRIKEDNKRFKEEVNKLKQKLIEDNTSHQKEIAEVKRKHWCSVCLQEAQYYCCWIGSYCSDECQKIHWKQSHKQLCRRHLN